MPIIQPGVHDATAQRLDIVNIYATVISYVKLPESRLVRSA